MGGPMELNGSVGLGPIQLAGADIRKVVEKAVHDLEHVLSGKNVQIMETIENQVPKAQYKRLPVLDEAKHGKSWKEDLARLISYLILEDSETQMKEAGRRMQSMTDKYIADAQDTQDQVVRAAEEAAEQTKKEKARKILGWILTALSVVAAVTSAVVTFGAAAPGAFMIVSTVASLVGAGISLVMTAMDEFGGTEAILKELAKSYQKDDPSLSDAEAMQKASENWSTGWMVVNTVLSVAAIAASITNLVKGAGAGVMGVSRALKFFQTGLTLAGHAGGGVQSYMSFRSAFRTRDAEKNKALLQEMMKFLDQLRQKIEEDRLIIEDIVNRLQNTVTAIVDIVTAGEDNLQLMMKNMGQMI